MTTITRAQRAAALAAAQDAPDAAAALDEIARIWGVTLPELEPSEEMVRIADAACRIWVCQGRDPWEAYHDGYIAGLQFAAEKAREQEGCTFGHLIDRHVFLTSIGAGHRAR